MGPLAKGLFFFWKNSRFFQLIIAIIVIDCVNPFGALNPIISKIFPPKVFFNQFFIFGVMPTIMIPIVLILTAVMQLLDVSIFTVHDPNRSSLGEIRENIPLFGRTNWKDQGFSEENQTSETSWIYSSRYIKISIIPYRLDRNSSRII